MSTFLLSDLGVRRQEGRLASGTRVVLFERAHAPISLKVSFIAGSRCDPPGKEGLAHFVEHMLVAGTQSFPRKDDLALYIERHGGEIGASTGFDIVRLNTFMSEPANVPILAKVLGEVLGKSHFDKAVIENERGSILKEIAAAESSPTGRGKQVFMPLVFQGTALSHPVLGTVESVKAITREDLLWFYKTYITSERATIVVAGDVSLTHLVSVLDKEIVMPVSGAAMSVSGGELPVIRQEWKRALVDHSDQVAIFFGVRACRVDSTDAAALQIVADVVGSGRASLLNTKLRYERGLVYGSWADTTFFRDGGSFALGTATSSQSVPEVLEIVGTILRDICEHGLPPDLLLAAKESASNSLRARFETSASLVNAHSYSETVPSLHGKTVADFGRQFMAVTHDDVLAVARRYFREDNWYLVTAGNVTAEKLPEKMF